MTKKRTDFYPGKLCALLACALVLLSLPGCAKQQNESADQTTETLSGESSLFENSQQPQTSFVSDHSNDLFLPESGQGAVSDNSLDAYSASFHFPLRFSLLDGEMPYGMAPVYFLSRDAAGVMTNHVFLSEDGSAESSWFELVYVTSDGQTRSHDLTKELPSDPLSAELAPYAMDFFADPDTKRGLAQQIRRDPSGNVHSLCKGYDAQTADTFWEYTVTSPDGSQLSFEEFPDGQKAALTVLYDGRVALLLGSKLLCNDLLKGESETLLTWKSPELFRTFFDETHLLYANSNGLYTCDLAGGNPSPLYLWNQHGLRPSEVSDIQVTTHETETQIQILYQDAKGGNYLRLTPTTEKIPVTKLVVAASSSKIDRLSPAVAAFNKAYPYYHITLREYEYQDPSLLTSLISGDGPVLIDSFLTGLDGREAYFEPLDEVFEQMRLSEELVPKVLDLCRIGGKLYGIPDSFCIDTLLTAFPDADDWNYQEFLDCIDRYQDDLDTLFQCSNTTNDGYVFLSKFFLHSMEDNFLFDAQTCQSFFDSEAFRKILRYGKRFQGRGGGYAQLLDQKMLCYGLLLQKPDQLALLRVLMKDQGNYVGYPAKDGAKHYMVCDADPLVVRASASAQEKRAAHSFLKILYSYDCQLEASKDLNYHLSVRKDVLEKQFATAPILPYLSYFPQVFLTEEHIDAEADKAFFYDLLDRAQVLRSPPRELLEILFSEVESYFEGTAEEEAVIRSLKNRVELYLKEQ